jgi:hypothetical protein
VLGLNTSPLETTYRLMQSLLDGLCMLDSQHQTTSMWTPKKLDPRCMLDSVVSKRLIWF